MKQNAFVASLLLCLLLCSVSFSAAESLVPASKLPAEPVFEPSKEYAEYTVVEYSIAGIDAVVDCTVNRKGDRSEYYVQCDLYGDNSESRSVLQNGEFVIKVSSSGLMEHITPDVLKMATDQNIWVKTEGTHDDSILPFAPVFTPINGYDEYTTVAYSVDGIDQELLCTISRKADNTDYYLECSLYGDNLMSRTHYSDAVFNILESNSGIMRIITPNILAKAIKQDIWIAIIEDTFSDVENEIYPESPHILAPVTFKSDNDITEMTFNTDGTYRFWFEAYSIEDLGTYTFKNGVLTLTDINGKTSVGEGNPIKLHYVYSGNNQLSDDYTIPTTALGIGVASVSDVPVEAAPAAEAPAAEPIVIASDDGGTEITFNPDGTYRFWFEAYAIEDLGTYTFKNGVLTMTDKHGKTSMGKGDPIKLYYTYSDSEQLTGDYTIPSKYFSIFSSWYDISSSNTTGERSAHTASTASTRASFTNKYGTSTTKCAHPGCSNYIASSGDTNCCVIHSRKCLECGKYIDEDATYCMDCIQKAAGATAKKSGRMCDGSGCSNVASKTLIVTQPSGESAAFYLCPSHYSEYKSLFNSKPGWKAQ